MNKNEKVNDTQGVKYNNNKKALKIDLPFELVEKLENIFQDENSKTFGKIIFTIYLINQGKYNTDTKIYENYYELSKTHYKTYVSLNQRFAPIMDKLIENGIIKKIGGYSQGKNYQKFKMVNPFTFKKNSKVFKSFFFTDDEGAYIKKYKADGYIVKYPEQKEKKIKPINRENKTDKKLMELQDLYNELQGSFNIIQQENFELKTRFKEKELESKTEVDKPTRTRTRSKIPSAVRSEMADYSIKLKAEAEEKKKLMQVKNIVQEQPAEVQQPIDYSQRATAYDSEIDKYIEKNIKDVNHIYHMIKGKKIDCVPYPQQIKETMCNGLWLAVNYKINENKKVA